MWIEHNSKYFRNVTVTTDAQRQTLTVLIGAASEYIEKVCNRVFPVGTHDEVFKVNQDGTIILDNPPVSEVHRLAFDIGEWVSISNTTAQTANVSVTDTGVKLTDTTGGTQTTQSLLFADYPTLENLVDEIESLTGWTASVETDYEDFPSSDLVAKESYFCAGQTAKLKTWEDYKDGIGFQESGILEGFSSYAGFKCRVVYVGGFDDVPEPIKLVCANLVIQSFEGKQIKQESIGHYSYTLEDGEKLSFADKKVLAYYRDRKV
jgi:hypothetical protein